MRNSQRKPITPNGEPLHLTVACGTKRHEISMSPSGCLTLCAHSKEEIRLAKVQEALGFEPKGCFRVLHNWRLAMRNRRSPMYSIHVDLRSTVEKTEARRRHREEDQHKDSVWERNVLKTEVQILPATDRGLQTHVVNRELRKGLDRCCYRFQGTTTSVYWQEATFLTTEPLSVVQVRRSRTGWRHRRAANYSCATLSLPDHWISKVAVLGLTQIEGVLIYDASPIVPLNSEITQTYQLYKVEYLTQSRGMSLKVTEGYALRDAQGIAVIAHAQRTLFSKYRKLLDSMLTSA